tara:strand:+ start:251 stop:553 length:303 start_codon:yes stop_codon:yes gene_type:complete
MLHEDLNDISVLNEKIEKALEDSNFIQLASLSSRLQSLVEMLTKNTDYKENVKIKDLDLLKSLLVRIDEYRVNTEKKFRDYTFKTSRQTKMQNAYKHSRG